MDKLVDCKRCGGNACYEQTVQDGLKTWMCMGCGFTTSDIMVENSEAHKALLETAPELYKDLLFVDDTFIEFGNAFLTVIFSVIPFTFITSPCWKELIT